MLEQLLEVCGVILVLLFTFFTMMFVAASAYFLFEEIFL